MAQRKIIWSHRARIKLYAILEYFAKRNKSKVYSAKLYRRFTQEMELVRNQPDLGIRTEIESVRGLIVGNYILFYEITSTHIMLLTVWDSRQDPQKLKVK
ncbi:MAG: type II toxin-antitoxin system RelE/ParE family toxin [Flavobacteriales bacterium]|nr:type II toxin-antitoxin system RelE/ParE family toxin [Flavobacteriales bacterium]